MIKLSTLVNLALTDRDDQHMTKVSQCIPGYICKVHVLYGRVHLSLSYNAATVANSLRLPKFTECPLMSPHSVVCGMQAVLLKNVCSRWVSDALYVYGTADTLTVPNVRILIWR